MIIQKNKALICALQVPVLINSQYSSNMHVNKATTIE